MGSFTGTSGDDNLVGGKGGNHFDITQGGVDTVIANAGDDFIRIGRELTAADSIDGGDGYDIVQLNGDYSAGVTLDADHFRGVEQIQLHGGHTYNFTFADGDYQVTALPWMQIGFTDPNVDAVVQIDASAVTTTAFVLMGGTGDDSLAGGAMADNLELWSGGNDSASGGGGDDWFSLSRDHGGEVSLDGGAGHDVFDMDWTYDLGDHIDGGDGDDILLMQGFDGDVVTLSGASISEVERIVLVDIGVHNLRLSDDLADSRLEGGMLTVTADPLFVASARIDGGRETDTSLQLVGGGGSDWLRGGDQADILDLNHAGIAYGDDTALGGKGADSFIFSDASLDANDVVNGGGGVDTLTILHQQDVEQVDMSGVVNVEKVLLGGAIHLVLADGNVRAGGTLVIDASASSDSFTPVTVDGSAETGGHLAIVGGTGADLLIGGGAADTLTGGVGADTLQGGGGRDVLVFTSVQDSTSAARDIIIGLTGGDVIDLSAIDANEHKAGDQGFTLVDSFTRKEGQAVLSYDKALDATLLSLDVDGDAVADAVIQIDGDHHGFDNFVL